MSIYTDILFRCNNWKTNDIFFLGFKSHYVYCCPTRFPYQMMLLSF